MANVENLERFGIDKPVLTQEQAKKNGRKGGKASVKSKRQKKTIAETTEMILNMPVTDKKQLAAIEKAGLPVPDQPTYKDFMVASIMLRTVQKGRVEDLEKLSSLVGETREDTEALNKLDEVLAKIGGVTNDV